MNINIHPLNTVYNQTYTKLANKNIKPYNTSFSGKEKLAVTLMGSAVGCLSVCLNENDLMLKNCIKSKSSDKFETYKNNVIEYFKKNEYQKYDREDENVLDYLQESEDIHELDFELEMYVSRILDKASNEETSVLNKDIDIKEKNKIYNDIETKIGTVTINVLKLSQKENINPEVIKIKNELEEKCGHKFLYMNNNIEFAKALKEVFKILEENNIPTKQINCIIASDNMDFGGLCINTEKGRSIVINPNCWQVKDIVHVILHEILHTLQPDDLSFITKEIPDEYNETIKNISNYAQIRKNFAHEVHCELYVKKLRNGLNPKEEKLFNYLGGTFL